VPIGQKTEFAIVVFIRYTIPTTPNKHDLNAIRVKLSEKIMVTGIVVMSVFLK